MAYTFKHQLLDLARVSNTSNSWHLLVALKEFILKTFFLFSFENFFSPPPFFKSSFFSELWSFGVLLKLLLI